MESHSSSNGFSTESLSQLKQKLQQINELLPLIPTTTISETANNSIQEDTNTSTETMPASYLRHLSTMLEGFRKDVHLYLTLSERRNMRGGQSLEDDI